MKILYWSGLFWPHIGGVEVLSLLFIPAMQKRRYEFSVVTSQTRSDAAVSENYNGININRFPFHNALEIHNLEEIKRIKSRIDELINNYKPDLIHLNSIDPSILFCLLANKRIRVPLLFTVHALPGYIINNNSILFKILSSADWITTASDSMLNRVQEILNSGKQNISRIYYGMELPSDVISPLNFYEPVLLCFGRLVREKGFDLAIEAFSRVVSRAPKTRLIIAGEGSEKFSLMNMASELGISSKVDFTGWIHPDKIPEMINKCSIVLIPSRWEEPFGLAALQAAQSGRPAIAARAGGLPEIVEDGKTGLLFEKENVDEIAAKMISLLEHPEIAIQMGQRAREKSTQFDFINYLDAYESLYKKLNKNVSVECPANS